MQNVFDLMKSYKAEWKEVVAREFTAEEQKVVESATVVPSTYGKSVCFLLPGGIKKYTPLEPIANCEIGDKLDMAKIKIVKLVYDGTNPEQKTKEIFRIRLQEEISEVVTSFDNPFGI